LSITSMTGFARAVGASGAWRWTVELKCVNAKGLDLRLRAPPAFDRIEVEAKARIGKALARGTCFATIAAQREGAGVTARVDTALMAQIAAAGREAAEKFGLAPPTLDGVLAVRGVVEVVEAVDDEAAMNAVGAAVLASLDDAIDALGRARRAEGGIVIDVASGAIVTEKLSMPHSPRWYDNRLWVLNSGTGHLGTVDLASGDFTPRAFCPGFLRGLAFHNNHAVVGLSLSRDGSFSGLALDDELKKRDADGWCGVQIVNLASGDIVQWIRIEGAVSELYDVAVLPGVRRPMAASFAGPEINQPMTFEM